MGTYSIREQSRLSDPAHPHSLDGALALRIHAIGKKRTVLTGVGGSRISGKGVYMYKGVGFAVFISFFLNIPRK